jgi:hypothetical protein
MLKYLLVAAALAAATTPALADKQLVRVGEPVRVSAAFNPDWPVRLMSVNEYTLVLTFSHGTTTVQVKGGQRLVLALQRDCSSGNSCKTYVLNLDVLNVDSRGSALLDVNTNAYDGPAD